MKAGKLCHRLRYQEATETVDALGQPVQTWATVLAVVWAEVRTPSGREAAKAQAWQASVDHVFVMRWPFYAIQPTGRFLDLDAQEGSPGGIYNIVRAVDEDGQRTTLTVYAAEQIQPTATNASNL
jgi:SPP1 family predicted phage head-tail adaptor